MAAANSYFDFQVCGNRSRYVQFPHLRNACIMEWIDLGYWGLFLATFLAATVLPFSSEVVLTSLLLAGFDPMLCLIVATVGNWLGGMSSYGLGWLGNWKRMHKWLRVKEASILKWKSYIDRYGPWTALLCWTPIIGDPIAIALGVFRVNWWLVSINMLLGKFGRYWLIISLVPSP